MPLLCEMLLPSPDRLGYRPQRIISVVPSQTELLYNLGLEKETIGITRFCIHPTEWFKNKSRVGGTKALHIEMIRSLKPDLIIANKEENDKMEVEELAADFPVWVTDVNTLEGALIMIKDIGVLTHKSKEAKILCEEINFEFKKLGTWPNLIPTTYLIWQNPLMTIGADSFISNMMYYGGFDNVFKFLDRYPEIKIADINNSGCKLLILSSEPFPFGKEHIEALQPLLPGIKIILADGEMFSWYGSRLLIAPAYFKKIHELVNV